jgi:alpha-ketoglutarate-dependent taurine dioxygenase
MYGAYDQLDQYLKNQLANKNAIHNLDFSRTRHMKNDRLTEEQRASVPPVSHPVFRVHPETHRTCIFLGDHAETIEGLNYEEGRTLVDRLNHLATPEELIYRHHWKPGQVVIWDNRCVLHRATEFDTVNDRRVMRRCTTLEERRGY